MALGRHFKLEESSSAHLRRLVLADAVKLAPEQLSSTITVLRTGKFTHSQYGDFEVTPQLLQELVNNFQANAYGQKILMDVAHEPEEGSAGEITRLFVSGDRLKAQVTWTPYGIKANRERGFIYVSAEYHDNYVSNEVPQRVFGAVLLGAALVTRPHIKGMEPVYLSESTADDIKTFFDPAIGTITMNEFLKRLREYLAGKKASKQLTDALATSFETEAKALGDDPAKLQTLFDAFKASADAAIKQLGEAANDQPVVVNVSTTGLSATDVTKMLEERETEQVRKLAEQQTALANKRKVFTDAIDAATGLSDAVKTELKANQSAISLGMTDEAAKTLAESFITMANRQAAQQQLAGMGYSVAGATRITVDDSNTIKSLQETVDQALRQSWQHQTGILPLQTDKMPNQAFVSKVLADFDRRFARQLAEEHKMLGSATNTSMTTSNLYLPYSVQRTVIREALANLNILQLVMTDTDPSATETTQIPYEDRFAGVIPNDGIVYEAQGIPSAGTQVKYVSAYLTPMKLAMRLSNESMFFSENGLVNWNAWAENIASNTRIMKELVHMRVSNEMLRASDTVSAIGVGLATAETLAATDAQGITKTAQFPIVRPFQAKNLKGVNQGNAECPVVVKVGAATLPYYTGGTLAAGNYWRFANLNLGYIQIVNQLGVPQAGVAATISYYTPSNIVKFDLNPASGVDFHKHLNGLLDAIGDQSAMMSSSRFVNPEYAAMSRVLNNTASKAEQFAVSLNKNGTNLNLNGDLLEIKGLPAFNVDAPGVDLASQRVLIGQRGLTAYKIAKAFSVGAPFEATNSSGQPTGEKIAYGEEYNSIYTPDPVRNRYTSVLVYDSTTR
ncbi:hypothetical protein [Thiolinea disciformis]|uniref:hypothetical protein n=1 Tax=Thiolinea disciformis TaxID=125614 RepID=UPI00037C9967|nr:hypothetical protein [Thiolinea disciformis]